MRISAQKSHSCLFLNMTDYLFFIPFSFLLSPKSDLCDALALQTYFRQVWVAYFLPRTNLYYILMMLWHFKVAIFLNMSDFLFFTPVSFILSQKSDICDALDLRIYFRQVWVAYFQSRDLYYIINDVVAL